jgi:hypothetical protein
MRTVAALAVAALAVAAAPAHARAADGFTGYEKVVTSASGEGEPEIAVGRDGDPLLVAYNGNGCGIAVSHDRGATFALTKKSPADPGPAPAAPAHNC